MISPASLRPAVALALLLSSAAGFAQGTVCATVKLEVQQEVTLARQAFEAKLKVNNTQPAELTGFSVQLVITKPDGTAATLTTDPASTSALFFYRVERTHPRSIGASSSQTLEWTLIPAPAAGGATAAGVTYHVGAIISYASSGQNETVTVAPDTIRVLPMPELQFDYFLAGDVQGDDPLTPAQEPVVPFTLGLRVKNVGAGTANALRVDSAQPVIVDNTSGARVQFAIRSARVDETPSIPALDVAVGHVHPGDARMVRWDMACHLAGRMTGLTATASHSDELGGAVTALLLPPASHLLVGNVIVDLPGRDTVRDFLAWSEFNNGLGGGDLTVYESGAEAGSAVLPAVAQFIDAPLTGEGSGRWRVQTPSVPPHSFLYARASDPTAGSLVPVSAKRSDGKTLPAPNAWASSRVETNAGQRVTRRYVHLFDANAAAAPADFSYVIEFGAVAGGNRPPVLGPLADAFAVAGQSIAFTVTAHDPDGAPPVILLESRPHGATFTDNLNGSATFAWTPQQTGTFPLHFTAADGFGATADRTILLTVSSSSRMDAWRERWWPGVNDPAITGNSADPDHDSLTNLYEYSGGLDPTRVSTEQRPFLTKEKSGGKTWLVYTVVRRTGDPALTVDAIASDDPARPQAEWAAVTDVLTLPQDGMAPGFERVAFRDGVALEDAAAGRYLRLRVRMAGIP